MKSRNPLKFPLLGLIWLYQRSLSGLFPNVCRYEPSCSRYAYDAVDRHGPLRGSWLAVRRLVRCRPGGGSGYDPVPEE